MAAAVAVVVTHLEQQLPVLVDWVAEDWVVEHRLALPVLLTPAAVVAAVDITEQLGHLRQMEATAGLASY
jgi:hypothetical protein